jgi:NADH dehydrogenase (ubiquinone) Fe-S protein 3
MASKLCRNRALASALRPARPTVAPRSSSDAAVVRCFATTPRAAVAVPKNVSNPRAAPRDQIGTLKAPLVNPADKYQSKADNLHKYGAWVMGSLPKYVQQFSVWKDELTIYISPAGVIPVFAFLKCKLASCGGGLSGG